MAILKFQYHCNTCNDDKYSYFSDMPRCPYCNSKDITKTDISAKKIDKFSDEGIKLRKKELEFNWSLKEEL